MELTNQRISLTGCLSLSWQHIRGIKTAVWLGYTICLLIALIVNHVISLKISPPSLETNFWFQIPLKSLIILQLFSSILVAPLITGILKTCVNHCNQQAVLLSNIFSCFKYTIKLSAALFVITLTANIANIGVYYYMVNTHQHTSWLQLLSVIFYPYLIYSLFALTLPLIYFKKLNIPQAFKQSMQTMTKKRNWLVLSSIYLLIFSTFVFSITPLVAGIILNTSLLMGIGLLFFILVTAYCVPYMYLVNAIVYIKLVDQN